MVFAMKGGGLACYWLIAIDATLFDLYSRDLHFWFPYFEDFPSSVTKFTNPETVESGQVLILECLLLGKSSLSKNFWSRNETFSPSFIF